jgi:hypothetical protein
VISRSLLRTPHVDVTEFTPVLGRVLGIVGHEPGSTSTFKGAASRHESNGTALATAALDARIAANPGDLRQARQRLRLALNENVAQRLQLPARLELSRAELELGLHPEAAASAVLVVRESRNKPDSLIEGAQWLLAEALYLAGRGDRALEHYHRLSRSGAPRFASAAALRLADIEFDRNREVPDYGERLAEIANHGVDPRPWAPRAAESAIRSGDLEAAESWLLRFLADASDSRVQGAAAIRLADLESTRGERQGARARLEAVETMHRGTPLGALAAVRLVELGLLEDPGEQLARLRAAARSPHPSVSANANALLGRLLLDLDRVDESVQALIRASRSAANPTPERTSGDLARALDALTLESQSIDCAALLVRFAVRLDHLIEHVVTPEPFLRLGACYEEIGLPATAMKIYRALARAQGPATAGAIALPIARSSLAVGDVAAAHTRALGHAPIPDVTPEWQVLLARSSLAGGDREAALQVLKRLVETRSPKSTRPATLALLARTAVDADPDATIVALLDAKLASPPPVFSDEEAYALGEAALLTATLQRRSGNVERAVALNTLAAEWLPEGWRRKEAGYWLERLGGGTEASSATFENMEATPLVARLWANARRIRLLRDRLVENTAPEQVATR